ncbi:MAG: DoxX family membrane protein [Maritimibacter sp.]
MIRSILARLDRSGDVALPSLARFTFAASLAGYFWASAMTKLGDGLFGFLHPALGAYAQIFPRQFEAVGYNISALSSFHWAVATAGMWAEFILPLLLILGLATRLAAFGMIGFTLVQSLTDIYGHGVDASAIGAWFDRVPDSAILDQRLFWVMLFVTLVLKGAGPISLDALVARRLAPVIPEQA